MAKLTLSPEDVDKLKTAERNVNEVLAEVDKLEDCDVDCRLYREELARIMNTSVKLRKNFAPQE